MRETKEQIKLETIKSRNLSAETEILKKSQKLHGR